MKTKSFFTLLTTLNNSQHICVQAKNSMHYIHRDMVEVSAPKK